MSRKLSAFVAYRHTGEDPAVLRPMLEAVCSALRERGVDVYCTFFSEEQFQQKSLGARDIMEHAFDELDRRNFLFVVQASPSKSEGMIMEVGYCRRATRHGDKKLIVVAIKEGVDGTYLPDMADRKITWVDDESLYQEILALDLDALLT